MLDKVCSTREKGRISSKVYLFFTSFEVRKRWRKDTLPFLQHGGNIEFNSFMCLK